MVEALVIQKMDLFGLVQGVTCDLTGFYRMCTSCSEREANVYADVHNICLTYTTAHAWCSTTTVNACILSAKMHMDSYIYIYSWSERRTVNPEVVGSIPAKTQKTENSNLHGFEVHRPSSKGTKLLLQVIKAIINQLYTYTHVHIYMYTCIHRYIYTYINTHIHIYMDTYIHAYAFICTYTYI